MRKLSKKRLDMLQDEKGTKVLQKSKVARQRAEAQLDAALLEVPAEKVEVLLQSHDALMGQVTELHGAMASVRRWGGMTFIVKRTRKNMADKLEVKCKQGASATFQIQRDADGYISGMSVVQSDPDIDITLRVSRDKNGVFREVTVDG